MTNSITTTSIVASSLPHFDRWTGGRTVKSLGTNDGSDGIAFQDWHRFKEAFAPELIARAVCDSSIQVSSCLDPFGGSGTTALACQMLGIESVSIEVNAFLADCIRAKLWSYNLDQIILDLATMRRAVRRGPASSLDYFGDLPKTFLERGDGKPSVFDNAVAVRIATLLEATDALEQASRNLFRVIVGGLLVDVSNVTISGKGRRYRRRPQDWLRSDPQAVDALFISRIESAIRDIARFSRRPSVTWSVTRADSRTYNLDQKFDLAVFSPPYPNSFDYTDVYNLELWMLGYLQSSADNRELRMSTLSSHVQLKRQYNAAPQGSKTLRSTLRSLHEVRSDLWNPHIPEMVGSYFADLEIVMQRVMGALNRGARCWTVIGDSQYAKVNIPVATILSELAASHDWNVVSSEPIRHMRSSPQQGWRPHLAETLFVLQAS